MWRFRIDLPDDVPEAAAYFDDLTYTFALDEAGKRVPDLEDLLVTDLVMPGGMSGQELAVELRKHNAFLKVVYTSGYSPSLAGRELKLDEGTAFLQKPFKPAVLLETVRRSLDEDFG